jgi:hypothetical protein
MSKTLFSIHGINTDGKWQQGIRDILDRFFDYRPLEYQEYRNLPLAVWRLGGDLVLLLLAVPAFVVWDIRYKSPPVIWMVTGIVLIFLMAMAINWLNAKCMQSLVERINTDVRGPLGGHANASVVAHSLGTLLVARALRRFESTTFDTIILHGCVVNRRYPWGGMLTRFSNVFNDIGGLDIVPRIAGTLRYTVPDIGSAGANGFKGPAVALPIRNPSSPGPIIYRGKSCCEAHESVQSTDQVHNVRFERIPHSGYHQGFFHAMDFWLPRLLGYDPSLYRKFYDDCVRVVSAEPGLKYEYKSAQRSLLETCYGWHPGRLETAIRSEVDAIAEITVPRSKVDGLIVSIVVDLTRAVYSMLKRFPRSPIKDQKLELPDKEDAIWDLLDPRSALQRSIAQSLQRAKINGIF